MSKNNELPSELESEKAVFLQTVKEADLSEDVGRDDEPPFDFTLDGVDSLARQDSEGDDGPFSDVPVIPTGIETLSEAWVRRWAEWIAAGRPKIAESERLAEVAELDWNPSLHPRDPRTGQFVERPFDLPDDVPDFGDMSAKETLSYIDENGGDVAGTVFDPDSPVTVDGVPNDATSLDDVGDGGADAADVVGEIEDIADGGAPDFTKRAKMAEVLEENTGISARFDDFSVEQTKTIASEVARLDANGDTDDVSAVRSLSSSAKDMGGENTNPVGAFVKDTMSVELNADLVTEANAESYGESGYLADGSVEHIVAHEFGHAVHKLQADRGEGEWGIPEMDDDTADTVESELSDYAATSPNEFVAEAFAVKARGGELPEDVEGTYNLLMGER